LYGCGIATGYALMKLLTSMAHSRLLPKTLGCQVYALLWGYIASLVSLVPAAIDVNVLLVCPCIVGVYSFLSYCIQIYCFLVLRFKLECLPREFRSPFGVAGAAFALAVFIVGIASGLSYRTGMVPTLTVMAIYLAAMSVYYNEWAKYVQTFSAAEKLVLLPAHVGIMNANGKPLCIELSCVLNMNMVLQNICTASTRY
jgi:amino acid transporter